VNFDRLAATGFETEWTLREGIRDIASELRGDARDEVTV